MRAALMFCLLLLSTPCVGLAREWSDASGHYTLEADLVARNHLSIVLQKPDKNLVMIKIDELSDKDKAYLTSLDEQQANAADMAKYKTWTLANGLEVTANAVEYAQRTVTIQRRRGKIYVNDKVFESLPEVYRRMLPRIVSHFEEGVDFTSAAEFEKWVAELRGAAKSYTLDGVLLELPSGDLYGVPFFLFSPQDAATLEQGWEQWAAAEGDSERRHELSLQLQARAKLAQQQAATQFQMQKMSLELQAYDAGLFDLWEVLMLPPQGAGALPTKVVVPARNSGQAAVEAQAKLPGYAVGGMARVNRR